MRNKPRRETRGVSRSKCADLITACVPVSWALSIIISESVDAADYYDGFGTGEIVVGIRAYQWGWEYFYPKGIDLNYNVSPSFSTVVGKSLKYTNSSSSHTDSNGFWKHYQNKNSNKASTTPAHLVLTPSDNNKVVNFMDFDSSGLSTYKNSTAFKKIQYFSKTNPQLLFKSNSDYTSKYQRLNSLYLNDSDFLKSGSYETLRQNNFMTSKSHGSNFSTVMDNKSVDKLVSYYLEGKDYKDNSWNNHSSKLNNRLSELSNSNNLTSNLLLNYSNLNPTHLKDVFSFPTKASILSSESDSKQNSNNFKYLLSTKQVKKNNLSSNYVYDLSMDGDFYVSDSRKNFSSDILNTSSSYRFKDLKSPDLSMLTSERNVRLLDKLNPSKFNPNYNAEDNNLNAILAQSSLSRPGVNQEDLYNSSSNNWAVSTSLFRLLNNNLTVPTSQIPLASNSVNFKPLQFDKFDKTTGELSSSMLQSKEESAPNFLFSNYWLTYWSNSNPKNVTNLNLSNLQKTNDFYMPMFVKYAEYDFRNWQAIELLEDAFWESTFSAFIQDEYLNTLQDINEYAVFKKQEELFDKSTRFKGILIRKKNKSLLKPFFKNSRHTNNLYSLPLFSEDYTTDPKLFKTFNFDLIGNEVALDSIEDSLDSLKDNLRGSQSSHLNTLSVQSLPVFPVSYTQVIDSFRADFDESSVSYDYNSLGVDGEDLDLPTTSDARVYNSLKLRSTARNSIVTFNAIQKVFKSRYDEGRSNARLQDLSNSYNSHPFLTAPRTSYENLLGKNKESFYNVNFYNSKISESFSNISGVWNSMNTYFIDIPFLVSNYSDSSRHLWFDWQSRWTSIEVQPSSVARYSLSGVPYFSKSSEYSTQVGDELNDSENYLNRLSRARKNYSSNWAYTPYLYNRSTHWLPLTTLNKTLYNYESMDLLKASLKNSQSFWKGLVIGNVQSSQHTTSFSSWNTPGRSAHQPTTTLSSYYYNNSILIDILSKREYVYRQFFASKGLLSNLPDFLTSSPKNPLIKEVLSTYSFIDPITFSSESTRDYMYQQQNFIKFIVMKDFLVSLNNSIKDSSLNLSFLNNYLFFYMFGDTKSNTLGRNLDLYKNQYRPMKKGVTNMVRLHTTGAIAMPIEIRLHILASSKDVIHSWAIPSAGIKIDCVPGYSSHRIAIFLCSGIFWGQCQEICGRFHHWMPIVVYFMKRDLFFLWCTHFIHYSSLDNVFNMTDKQLSDCVRLASFDKSSWINEFNRL